MLRTPPRFRPTAVLPALAVLALALGALPVGAVAQADDDLVPATVDALLAAVDAEPPIGLPVAAGGPDTFSVAAGHTPRCLVDVGDVTGDGAPDLAVGYDVRTTRPDQPTLEVLDGRTGERVWAAREGRGFRSLHGLSARDGRLVGASESQGGLVACRDAATGVRLWTRQLAPSALVTLHAARLVDDLSGDDVPDVLVAGGRGLDAVVLLSGADGATLWSHATGDVVYDVALSGPFAGDGAPLPAVLAVGGDEQPFARLLAGADGELLEARDLPAPGTVLLSVGDVDGGGDGDFAVGLFAAPDPCLLALDGRSLDTLWEAPGQTFDVTSLAPLGDVNATGLVDIAVGSLDNAMLGYVALNGIQMWRREVSTFNGGHILGVAPLGDVDGNGYDDVAGASFDTQVYVAGGFTGQFLAAQQTPGRLVVAATLGDGDGDGRPEIALGGDRRVSVFGGSLGLADGPELFVSPPDDGGEIQVQVFAYPSTALFLFWSRGTGSLELPGFEGSFGLDLPSLVLHFTGTAPGAGISGYIVGPFPHVSAPTELFFQAVSVYGPDLGKFSNVESVLLGR